MVRTGHCEHTHSKGLQESEPTQWHAIYTQEEVGTSLVAEMEAKGFGEISAGLLYTLKPPDLQMTQSSSGGET